MKKFAMLVMATVVLGACTNQKVVQYNTDRLDHIEQYLSQNKAVKNKGESLEKLAEEGKIEYTEDFKSLEKEAEAWLENQQK